jgi:hypothetical protein
MDRLLALPESEAARVRFGPVCGAENRRQRLSSQRVGGVVEMNNHQTAVAIYVQFGRRSNSTPANSYDQVRRRSDTQPLD